MKRHSNHEMIEFSVLREVKRVRRAAILECWWADSDLFRRLVDRVS